MLFTSQQGDGEIDFEEFVEMFAKTQLMLDVDGRRKLITFDAVGGIAEGSRIGLGPIGISEAVRLRNERRAAEREERRLARLRKEAEERAVRAEEAAAWRVVQSAREALFYLAAILPIDFHDWEEHYRPKRTEPQREPRRMQAGGPQPPQDEVGATRGLTFVFRCCEPVRFTASTSQ